MMTSHRSTLAFVSGLILTTVIAAILAFLPAGSNRWSSFGVAAAVPMLLTVVLTLSVIRMTTRSAAKSTPSLTARSVSSDQTKMDEHGSDVA